MAGNLEALAGLGLLTAFEDLTDVFVDPFDLHTELVGRYAGGTMAQNDAYHDGVFAISRTDDDPYETRSIYITLSSKNYSWSVNVYPDSENTIRWMRDNGLLAEDVTIQPQGSSPRYY